MSEEVIKNVQKTFGDNNVTRMQRQAVLQADFVQSICAKTKLMIPSPPQKAIKRINLMSKLDEALNKKLTILSAPAGYGKTTLMSEWAIEVKKRAKVAWVSLSDRDNDNYTFWFNIALALQDQLPDSSKEIMAIFNKDWQPQAGSIINAIINDLMSNNETEFIMVLDDYHLITDSEINRSVQHFISHMPANLHMSIVTRYKPKLALARLKVKDELLELNGDELRFSSMEIAELYSKSSGIELDEEISARIEASTEGWAIAVRLFANSLEKAPDSIGTIARNQNYNTRYFMDYLSEEIIDQLDENFQLFLYKTSILPLLNAQLCNYVLDVDDSQATMDRLIEKNTFIVALDENSDYYRYHQIFSDFLFCRLRRYYGKEIKSLYMRAGNWFENSGDFYQALDFYYKANDRDSVERLTEICVEKIAARGEFNKLIGIIEILPMDALKANPRLYLYYGMALAIVGRFHEKEEELKRQNIDLFCECIDQYRGVVYVIRSYAASFQSVVNKKEVEENAKKALSILSENNNLCLLFKAYAFASIAQINRWDGKFDEAIENFHNALQYAKRADHAFVIAGASYGIAFLKYSDGKLKEALEILESALAYFKSKNYLSYPCINLLLWPAAGMYYEMNDIEKALSYAIKSMEHSRSNQDEMGLMCGMLTLVKIWYAKGKKAGVMEILKEMERMYDENKALFAFYHNLPDIVRIYINLGEAGLLLSFAEKYGIKSDENVSYANEPMNIAAVEILLYNKNYAEAENRISKLLIAAQEGRRKYIVLKLLILQSICRLRRGYSLQSLETICKAVDFASVCGYQRVFYEHGNEVIELLHELRNNLNKTECSSDMKEFLEILLSNGEDIKERKPVRDTGIDCKNPLSPRELEVLDCIVEGLTNIEVSKKLYISTSTVKKHIKSIFEKLKVNNRTKAIKVARAKNII